MFSRQTINRAVNSIHGQRLTEIALEHAQLANKAITLRHSTDLEIIDARIKALREERDLILDMYEGGDSDA